MYSLPAKVIQVNSDVEIYVQLKDNAVITVRKDADVVLKYGDFISVMGCRPLYDMCGKKPFTCDFVWTSAIPVLPMVKVNTQIEIQPQAEEA